MIPVGVFQPSGEAPWNEANDFSLWRGLLREYAEELLGADEDYGSELAPIDYRAWPLARAMTDGLADGRVRAWCLGLGADPLTFAIDLLAVVVIDAPLYDDLFGDMVDANAEGRVTAPAPSTAGQSARCCATRPSRRPPRPCSPWPSSTAAPSSANPRPSRLTPGGIEAAGEQVSVVVRPRAARRRRRAYR